MKTTLTLLIAGLIFLATPLLASADRGEHRDHKQCDRGWVQGDRYNHNHHFARYDQRRGHRYEQRYNHQRNHRIKRHLRRELRETRQELRQVKRQIRHNQRRYYYARPYYSNPAVIIGVPHLVFQFDW